MIGSTEALFLDHPGQNWEAVCVVPRGPHSGQADPSLILPSRLHLAHIGFRLPADTLSSHVATPRDGSHRRTLIGRLACPHRDDASWPSSSRGSAMFLKYTVNWLFVRCRNLDHPPLYFADPRCVL